ncbi:phage holin family protein [Undibacterium sp. RTI2.1]|uniref:phage holin family protein n=1 Tax=unclassified Undibacterium TaxID=2630295 RepID=UPI002AB5AE73|nr:MULTISPECIES: phage holin family protein [unclassified Undibacterium]MDY7536842.1 phage holin family protein [Undibacterium sp. 5I1]MEB0029493.1 phage holin family protein [Undibacterium sp. RTI2.1]MEB0115679.1 phage holin family protein [Undibacterium sp. RTI2.2]MEB0231998.1 phage holin family protein [Undibacterium sp. 10I3]MEB0256724.1 phage holin family protein [Undibacterium sp. 5I1]
MTDNSNSAPAVGLMAGLAGVAKNGFGLLLSRLELAALELSELRNHALKIALVFALAILAIWFALAYGTALVVYLSWDALGWKILFIMSIVFVAIAVGLLLYLLSMVKHGKLSLPVTMAELKSDRDMLL